MSLGIDGHGPGVRGRGQLAGGAVEFQAGVDGAEQGIELELEEIRAGTAGDPGHLGGEIRVVAQKIAVIIEHGFWFDLVKAAGRAEAKLAEVAAQGGLMGRDHQQDLLGVLRPERVAAGCERAEHDPDDLAESVRAEHCQRPRRRGPGPGADTGGG